MTTAIATATDGIDEFKSGVDALLEKRRYFKEKLLPTLTAGKDYLVIKGRKSLGKSGAERIVAAMGLVATFAKDSDAMSALTGIEGLIALKCTLTKNGVPVAEGSGAAVLKEHNANPNTLVKVCEKRAFVSAVIRASSLSDLFSQDLEDLPESAIQPSTEYMSTPESEASLADDPHYPYEPTASIEENDADVEPSISERQISFLRSLVMEHLPEGDEREKYVASMEAMSRSDASQAIKGMLALAGR